ncbi:MAG: TolC family outer membrane protein [Rhodospirillales bacterium]
MKPLGRILCVAVTAGACLAFGNGIARSQPLEAELDFLIRTHPKINEARKRVESARQEVESAKGSFLPTVTATGDYGPEVIDNPTERASGDGEIEPRARTNAGVTVTQNLFDGFNTQSSVRSARFSLDAAQKELSDKIQTQLFEGIKAYLAVLRHHTLLRLARENERNITQLLDLEDERVRRGSGITLDVLTAKQRLQRAKETRVTYEGDFEKSMADYIRVFDHSPNIPNMRRPKPPRDVLPPELEEAIDIARHENASLKKTAAEVEVARENKRQVKSSFYPTFDLVGDWGYEKNNNGTLGTRRDYSLVLEFNWDLYEGGSTRADYKKAQFDYGASQDVHTDQARLIDQLTRTAWHELVTATERVSLLDNAVLLAEEVVTGRRKLREAGKETVINVLDSESELNNARIQYTEANYAQLRGIYNMMLAMGRLSPALLNLKQLAKLTTEDVDRMSGSAPSAYPGDPFAGTPAGRDSFDRTERSIERKGQPGGEPPKPSAQPVAPVQSRAEPLPAPEAAPQQAPKRTARPGSELSAPDEQPSIFDSLPVEDDPVEDFLFGDPPGGQPSDTSAPDAPVTTDPGANPRDRSSRQETSKFALLRPLPKPVPPLSMPPPTSPTPSVATVDLPPLPEPPHPGAAGLQPAHPLPTIEDGVWKPSDAFDVTEPSPYPQSAEGDAFPVPKDGPLMGVEGHGNIRWKPAPR